MFHNRVRSILRILDVEIDDFSGNAGKVLQVNADEDGVDLGVSGSSHAHGNLGELDLVTDGDHDVRTDVHFLEGAIDHLNILNIGTNAHSVIDSHIASTANPHSVLASQVSTDTTNFDTALTSADDTVQKALDTLDDAGLVEVGKVNEVGGIMIGQPAYISGVTGDKPQASLADNTVHNKAHSLGIACETKSNNQNIRISRMGFIENVDTSGYSTGRLHLLTNGTMQNAAPTSGAHIHMGWVTKADATEGIILVDVADYVHDIRGVDDQQIEIACGDDDDTGFIYFQNYSRSNLGYMRGDGLFNWDGVVTFGNTLGVTGNITGPNVTSGTDPGHLHNASSVIYDGTETVEEVLDDTLNQGVLDAIVTSDDGGLNTSWAAGEIFDHGTTSVVDTDSGNDTCTDNTINYLKWVSGTTLALGVVPASGNEIAIATYACQAGDIWDISENNIISHREQRICEAMANMFPSIVTSGILVSEDTDVTNVWDVVLSAGVYYIEGHEKHAVNQIFSRIANMVRWYHSGGVWTSDTDAEIDNTQWDNGTNLVAVSASKYYASMFMVVGSTIHWIYPDYAYNTVAGAIAGGGPSKPPGLELHPFSTCVVIKGNAAAFPASSSDQWADVRPRIGGTDSGSVSDHVNLTNIGTNTHAQIDTHMASTANPHSVNYTQAGAIQDTTDIIKDTHIDWGSGANQIDADDLSTGSVNAMITVTQLGTVAAHISDGTKHFLEGDIDHGAISGLTDDDHTGYILANGTRGLSSDWDVGSHKITSQNLTIDSMTLGSILFAGTGGLTAQDNSNLFWDNANNRFSIGTVSPPSRFTIQQAVDTTEGGLSIINTSGGSNRYQMYVDGSSKLHTRWAATGSEPLVMTPTGIELIFLQQISDDSAGAAIRILTTAGGSNYYQMFVDAANDLHFRLAATGAELVIDSSYAFSISQSAHIIDADGTLADITTKFNTLLARIEALGFLASA